LYPADCFSFPGRFVQVPFLFTFHPSADRVSICVFSALGKFLVFAPPFPRPRILSQEPSFFLPSCRLFLPKPSLPPLMASFCCLASLFPLLQVYLNAFYLALRGARPLDPRPPARVSQPLSHWAVGIPRVMFTSFIFFSLIAKPSSSFFPSLLLLRPL
jgi:hypothetical protein